MGFIRTLTEVKLVLLYVLNRLTAPIAMRLLTETAQVDDGFTYFDAVQAVSELIATGHAEENGEGFSSTAKGRSDGDITESDIPYSVRLKLDANIDELKKELDLRRMVAIVRRYDK